MLPESHLLSHPLSPPLLLASLHLPFSAPGLRHSLRHHLPAPHRPTLPVSFTRSAGSESESCVESVPAPLSRMWRVFKQHKYFSVYFSLMILKGISTTFYFYDHSANWKLVKIYFSPNYYYYYYLDVLLTFKAHGTNVKNKNKTNK